MRTNLSFWGLFFEVWIHPRKVIRLILETEQDYFVWPMVIMASFLGVFHHFKLFAIPNYLSFSLLFFGDVFLGILAFLIYSWAILGIGKWSGGKGTYAEIKTACAWAYPPYITGLFLDFLRRIQNWKMVFQGGEGLKDFLTAPMADGYHIFSAISYLLGAWYLVLTVVNVSQAHKISIWKSVFATTIFWLLGWLLLFIIVFYFACEFNNPQIP